MGEPSLLYRFIVCSIGATPLLRLLPFIPIVISPSVLGFKGDIQTISASHSEDRLFDGAGICIHKYVQQLKILPWHTRARVVSN